MCNDWLMSSFTCIARALSRLLKIGGESEGLEPRSHSFAAD